MSLSYTRLFISLLEDIEPLTMEERGRLLTAMLVYGESGELPAGLLSGHERFLFPMCRRRIDQDAASYGHRVAANRVNGAKGGRPRKNPMGFSKTEKTQLPNRKEEVEEIEEAEEIEYTEASESSEEKEAREFKEGVGGTRAREASPAGLCDGEDGRTGDDDPASPEEADPDNRTGGHRHLRARRKPHSKSTPAASPSPPTLDEVKAFCEKHAPSVDAGRFWNHYQANGWRAAGLPIQSWRAKLLEWELGNRDGPPWAAPSREAAQPVNPALNYEQREYRPEDFDESFFIDLDAYGSA